MKLGELRSAIRNTKGNPSIITELVPGKNFTLSLQKTPLMEELERIFPDGKTVETGLTFDPESGILGTGRQVGASVHAPKVDTPLEEIDYDGPASIQFGGDPRFESIMAQLGETGEGLGVEPEEDDDLLV